MAKKLPALLGGAILFLLISVPVSGETDFTYWPISYENGKPNALYLAGSSNDLKEHARNLKDALQYISHEQKSVLVKTETILSTHENGLYTSVVIAYFKPQSENDKPFLPPLPNP